MKLTQKTTRLGLAALVLGAGLWIAVPAGSATPAVAASADKSGHQPARQAAAAFPLTVRDDTGRKVVIRRRPTRIISLTLGTDEILTSLVPIRELLGIDYYSTQPIYSHIAGLVKRDHLTIMGGASGEPSAETIIKAKPDLVLVADYDNQNLIRQIAQAGIAVYEFSTFNSISDIQKHIQTLGKLVGEKARADALVARMNRQLQQWKKSAPKHALSVLYYTSFSNVISIGATGTTADSIIRAAGGVNAAAGLQGWSTVSAEKVLQLNPDVVVIPDDSGSQQLELKQFLANPLFRSLRAVREHRVYTAPDGNLSAVSQYVLLGVQDMRDILTKAGQSK